nr:MAG TPA: hypothetical protein [Bacteriophage sp.]
MLWGSLRITECEAIFYSARVAHAWCRGCGVSGENVVKRWC